MPTRWTAVPEPAIGNAGHLRSHPWSSAPIGEGGFGEPRFSFGLGLRGQKVEGSHLPGNHVTSPKGPVAATLVRRQTAR